MSHLDLTKPHHQLLRERLQPYIDEATSKATRKAYRTDLAHFQEWGGGLPATPQLVADYLVHLAQTHKPSTLQRRLAAISRAHNTLGYPNPVSTELVRLTLRGIRRKVGTQQRQARPLMKDDLMQVLAVMGDSLRDHRDRALLLLGFAGAFRRSELVGLDVADLTFTPQGCIVTLRHSKTDQEGQGRNIGIPYGRNGTCPVRAVQAWLTRANITEGAVFRPITRTKAFGCAQLSDRAVADIIKQRAAAAGLSPDSLSGHSLRAGLATSAAQAGIRPDKIRQQTGHASDAMLQRYIRDGDLFNGNAGGIL